MYELFRKHVTCLERIRSVVDVYMTRRMFCPWRWFSKKNIFFLQNFELELRTVPWLKSLEWRKVSQVNKIQIFCSIGGINQLLIGLTLLVAGGKSALRPSKWHPNTPKYRDFSYFYMTYMGGGETPPPTPLNVYFQPHHIFDTSSYIFSEELALWENIS